MKITNTLSVKMNWDSFTFPILVGTPVSTAGVLANSADAVGIVPRTVIKKPDAGDELYLMTGGSIYLSEVAYTDLSVAAMQELDGIDFYKANGHVQQKGGSGGGLTPEQEALIQNAQWKTAGTSTLFTETVTTSYSQQSGGNTAIFTDHELIESDTITVTFDGVDYVCHKTVVPGIGNVYGASFNLADGSIDFSDYPFLIGSTDSNGYVYNMIYTEDASTHTVSVAVPTVEYTEAFATGVEANIPATDYNKIGGVQKIRFTESASPGEDVDANLINDLLQALDDAGIIHWDTLS